MTSSGSGTADEVFEDFECWSDRLIIDWPCNLFIWRLRRCCSVAEAEGSSSELDPSPSLLLTTQESPSNELPVTRRFDAGMIAYVSGQVKNNRKKK
jgi:hypothetical protein